MATCVVSGVIKDPSSTAIEDATIEFNITSPVFSTTIQIVPKKLSTTTDSDGAWSLTIERSITGVITIKYPPNSTDSSVTKKYSVTIPAAATADFSTLATEL